MGAGEQWRNIIAIVIIGAITYVASRAVSDAFESLFEQIMGERDTVRARFVYAAVVITIAVVFVFMFYRWKKESSE